MELARTYRAGWEDSEMCQLLKKQPSIPAKELQAVLGLLTTGHSLNYAGLKTKENPTIKKMKRHNWFLLYHILL